MYKSIKLSFLVLAAIYIAVAAATTVVAVAIAAVAADQRAMGQSQSYKLFFDGSVEILQTHRPCAQVAAVGIRYCFGKL